MDSFILASTLLSVAKLAIALGFLCIFGWGLEKALGFDMEKAVDYLEASAKKGNALPLAIVLAALVITLGGILERFQ